MTATYTFDIFQSLDGFGSHDGDWGGYWGKQGPEFIAHRAKTYEPDLRIVFGANTYRNFVEMLSWDTGEPDASAADQPDADGSDDTWVTQLRAKPLTVISSTLTEPLEWADATVAPGDGAETVRRLKEESDVPLRSHGSLQLNWSLLAAGLVDLIEVTVFPVVTGTTGRDPIWAGAGDLDLDLVDQRTYDGRTQVLTYRPTVH